MSNLKYPISELNSKLAKRMFISNLEECERFPKYFEVETVNACNARCICKPAQTGNERP